MKIKSVLVLIIILISIFPDCFSQTGPMQFNKSQGGGFEFVENGQLLTMRSAVIRMEKVTEAHQVISKAKQQTDIATILQFAGGFMVGWPVGTAIGGGDADWVLAGVGIGVFAASIPFHLSFKKNSKKAVKIYNQSMQKEMGFDFQISAGKCGLVINF